MSLHGSSVEYTLVCQRQRSPLHRDPQETACVEHAFKRNILFTGLMQPCPKMIIRVKLPLNKLYIIWNNTKLMLKVKTKIKLRSSILSVSFEKRLVIIDEVLPPAGSSRYYMVSQQCCLSTSANHSTLLNLHLTFFGFPGSYCTSFSV